MSLQTRFHHLAEYVHKTNGLKGKDSYTKILETIKQAYYGSTQEEKEKMQEEWDKIGGF